MGKKREKQADYNPISILWERKEYKAKYLLFQIYHNMV